MSYSDTAPTASPCRGLPTRPVMIRVILAGLLFAGAIIRASGDTPQLATTGYSGDQVYLDLRDARLRAGHRLAERVRAGRRQAPAARAEKTRVTRGAVAGTGHQDCGDRQRIRPGSPAVRRADRRLAARPEAGCRCRPGTPYCSAGYQPGLYHSLPRVPAPGSQGSVARPGTADAWQRGDRILPARQAWADGDLYRGSTQFQRVVRTLEDRRRPPPHKKRAGKC